MAKQKNFLCTNGRQVAIGDCKLFNQSGSENLNLDSNVFNSNRTGSRVSKLFSLSQLKQFLYPFESTITSGITKTVKPKIYLFSNHLKDLSKIIEPFCLG